MEQISLSTRHSDSHSHPVGGGRQDMSVALAHAASVAEGDAHTGFRGEVGDETGGAAAPYMCARTGMEDSPSVGWAEP